MLTAGNYETIPLSTAEARHRSIVRMARTAVVTSQNSNGQLVRRRVKNKAMMLTEAELCKCMAMLFERQQGLCAITGLTMQLDTQCSDLALLPSLDRIDSQKHYSADNLQLVCRFINKWKGAERDEEFRRMISLIRDRT
ncbi:MAG: hypothetical protein C6Y20_14235 [Tagaea sp. CACIAM 22H2]|nr:hypothetical protein [Tagaea sp. CACIAM 22H2]